MSLSGKLTPMFRQFFTMKEQHPDDILRVPLLIRWPNHIQPGLMHTFPVDHCDLWATLLDAAGVDAQAAAKEVVSPGKSYLPKLRGEALEWRDWQACEHSYSRMVRTPAAKLIRRWPCKVADYPDEFYDLKRDPRETMNVIDDPIYTDTISQLDRIMESHFKSYEDPQKAGINMETILPHNMNDPWETLAGADDHRQ